MAKKTKAGKKKGLAKRTSPVGRTAKAKKAPQWGERKDGTPRKKPGPKAAS
jgi:hypothetical protein